MLNSPVERVDRRLLHNIPEEHRSSDDSRLMWLWNQRIIVVQSIYSRTDNIRDRMAASIVLSAAWTANLPSIELLLRRLEGGAMSDTEVVEGENLVL